MLHVDMILGKDMLHVGVILGERDVTCRHDSCYMLHVGMILGKDMLHVVTCRHDSGGKICYM